MLKVFYRVLLVIAWWVEHFLVRIKWVLLLLPGVQALLWIERRLLTLYITSNGFSHDFWWLAFNSKLLLLLLLARWIHIFFDDSIFVVRSELHTRVHLLLLILLCRKWHLFLVGCHLERVVGIKVIDQPLQLLNLHFDGLCCFEILPINRFLLSKFEHTQITSDQFQFVGNLLQLHRHIVIFLLDGFLFLF